MAITITDKEREQIPNHEHLMAVIDRMVTLVNDLESRIQTLENA